MSFTTIEFGVMMTLLPTFSEYNYEQVIIDCFSLMSPSE